MSEQQVAEKARTMCVDAKGSPSCSDPRCACVKHGPERLHHDGLGRVLPPVTTREEGQ